MSYVSAYSHKPPDSKGMVITAAVHVAIVVAVLAYPAATFVQYIEPEPVKAIDIRDPKPEPPPPNPPETETPRLEPKLTPVVPLPRLPDAPETQLTAIDDAALLARTGGGTGIPVDDLTPLPPITEPVLTDAALNTRYSRQFQPDYPSGQLRLGNEAVISVRVLVGANGRAKKIELVSSPHKDFWNATRRHALKKWRFTPATKDGQPVESWITLKVRFEINS